MRRQFFSAALIMVTAFAFIISGCGKSDKEVKTGEKQTASDNKTGKTMVIDVEKSTAEWLGKKVTGQHNGTIKFVKGDFNVDNGKVTGGKFEMDMNSIVVLDLTDAAMNAKLTGHLKSDDFFSSAKFPSSKFEITKVDVLSDPGKPGMNSTVTGNLTIKDITKSISFPAEIKIENGVLNAKADFDIDRTEWNVKYGSGKFFENLGDKMINDNFNLKLSLTAK
ncbi:MAG: YceI family protein [Ignavibacteria bacterium]|nr:YceI family protein [Ignavibacteria bacterium]